MKKHGFTLVELLTVIAIMSILLGLGAKSLEGVLSASGISEAVGLLESELDLARQSANVTNREHEIRFYRYRDPASAFQGEEFRAFQIVVREPVLDPSAEGYNTPGTAQFDPPVIPINRIRTLPEGVILIADQEKSPLLIHPSRSSGVNSVTLWQNIPATYTYFRFKPGGGTDLELDKDWYFTVALEEHARTGNLKNIATMKLDPSSGKITWLRP